MILVPDPGIKSTVSYSGTVTFQNSPFITIRCLSPYVAYSLSGVPLVCLTNNKSDTL